MSKKISCLVKRPGEPPRHVNISDSLENLQKTVGGYIETVTLMKDLVLICDEEGLLKNTKFNVKLLGMQLFGPIIICGTAGEEFADLPVSWAKLKELLPELWKEDTK